MSEAEADIQFQRDLMRAIEESKVTAGLIEPLEDYVAVAEVARENSPASNEAEDQERMSAQQDQMRHMENIELELSPDCAICMLLIVRPTRLPCKHVFCQGCAQASLKFKWECPMCRFMPPKGFKFPLAQDVMEQLKEKIEPELWEAREKQLGVGAVEESKEPEVAAQEAEAPEFEDSFDLKIKYGNRHQIIPNAPILKNGKKRNHQWTVFVQLNHGRIKAQDVFSEVMFTLPPCYSNRYRSVRSDNSVLCRNAKSYFECKEAGWGQVNVQIEVTFREDLGYPLRPFRLQQMTRFDDRGDVNYQTVKIPRALAEQLQLVKPREQQA